MSSGIGWWRCCRRCGGLDVTRPILAVLDGAAALAAAVREAFDHPVIGLCQLHKLSRDADRAALALLTALAKELERTHPGAAASLARGHARDADRGVEVEPCCGLRRGLCPSPREGFDELFHCG